MNRAKKANLNKKKTIWKKAMEKVHNHNTMKTNQETTKNNRKPDKIQCSHGEPNKENAREKTAQVQSS